MCLLLNHGKIGTRVIGLQKIPAKTGKSEKVKNTKFGLLYGKIYRNSKNTPEYCCQHQFGILYFELGITGVHEEY